MEPCSARELTQHMTDFIYASPSPFHAVANFDAMLAADGAIKLNEGAEWDLQPGRTYYLTRNGSAIVAWRMPDCEPADVAGYMMAAAHSDSPCFKIKRNPEIEGEGAYVKLNVEKYGGMLCNPWFDRPLSIAGRAIVRQGNALVSKLVDLVEPTAMIPNLAIHMNRAVNDGVAIKVQSDMLPIIGSPECAGELASQVAANIGVDAADIVDSDLFLYNLDKPTVWGARKEYVSSRRLDDLECAWSIMTAFCASQPASKRINLAIIFDNEEVGSGTAQGADGTLLSDVIARITEACGQTAGRMRVNVANSFMVSADNAHAVHPNFGGKACPTNRPVMNGGVVLKYSANQKYCTDAVSGALFTMLCERAGAACQPFFNHSDVLGGSTLGNISVNHVSVKTVDVGLPQLAMHSPYETAGVEDCMHLVKALGALYTSAVTMDADGSLTLG